MWISIVIPALNEEEPIAQVVREVLATKIPREVIVVDNGSTFGVGNDNATVVNNETCVGDGTAIEKTCARINVYDIWGN